MPEQLLDHPQIGATFEQVGREGMAQRVGADLAVEPGARRRTVDGGPRLLPGEAPPTVAQEQRTATHRRDVMGLDEDRSRPDDRRPGSARP